MLDGQPPPISNSEKELTRKERSTLTQLRSGYCILLCTYKSIIKKDADCGTTPHDVKHLFVCPDHPTTLIPSDLWSRPTDAVRELSYLEVRDPDRNEHGLKDEQQQQPLDLRTDPARVTALLARWTEKLAVGSQAGISDASH